MKILSTKKYNYLIEQNQNLIMNNYKFKKEFEEYNDIIQKLTNELDKSHKENERNIAHIKAIQDEFSNFKEYAMRYEADIEKKLTSLKKAKGGYKKEINKQKKRVEELELKLKESMTDKYLVKKISPGRTAKTNFTKIKNSSKNSNIMRKLHKED